MSRARQPHARPKARRAEGARTGAAAGLVVAVLGGLVTTAPLARAADGEAAPTPCSAQATSDGLVPVLQLEVPVAAAWMDRTPPYSFDGTDAVADGFDRVGYCLETVAGDASRWVWAAMEPFTDDVSRLGPHTRAGQVTRQRVDDLTVASNVGSVRTGQGMTGYLEMWPNTYEPTGSRQVANASPAVYDADDSPAVGTHGSFQVSAVGDEPQSDVLPTTVLALNQFTKDASLPLDVGIGAPASGSPDWTFAENADDFSERTLTIYARPSVVSLSSAPQDRQLFPRDDDDGADVTVAGTVTDPDVDRVRLTVTSEGVSEVAEQSGPAFSFDSRITAGLHDYDLRLEAVTAGVPRTVGHWTHVVSGDAYVIQGQSNAQAAAHTAGSTVEESEFIRSFGSTTPDPSISAADRAWNYAGGDLSFNQAAVGQWALRMAHSLVESERVPVALLNGAHDGASVEFLQRNDADPGDIRTNYGRLRQRLGAAGLRDDLSGVFWYQGEHEGEDATRHLTGFRALLADWRTDLGGARAEDPEYYVFQVRTTGCFSVAGAALRDAQRRLGSTDGVTVLSTTAVPGHDGCHFTWPGYRALGDQVADTVRRDLFGGPSDGVAAPNPLSVELATRDGASLEVQLASATDALTVDEGVEADFRLLGSDATITDVRYAGGGRLELALSRPAPEATGLTYLGHLGDGPFITTTRGVGLLAFNALPITRRSEQQYALGEILLALDALDEAAAGLAADGELDDAQHRHVADAVDRTRAAVRAAVSTDGDRAAQSGHLLDAVGEMAELSRWVEGAGLAQPALDELRPRVADLQRRLSGVTATALGVTVTADPLDADVVAGQVVDGTVRIASRADQPLRDVSVAVAVESWAVDVPDPDPGTVPAGGSAEVPFTATVPAHHERGPVNVTTTVTFTVEEGTFTLTSTRVWGSVASQVEIGAVTSEQADVDPPDRTTLTATVTNRAATEVHGHLVVRAPDGWRQPVPSAPVVLGPGESRAVSVPLAIPLDVVAGPHPVTVSFEQAGAVLADTTGQVEVVLPAPPTGEVLDHVDFGDGPSEAAHGITASSSSGVNVEAGLTRRYAHNGFPGSWFAVDVDVVAGEPFVLRAIETFGLPRTKKYHVYVDDVRVATQVVTRTAGAGTEVYDLLVDDPEVLDNDGSVRVRFEYPTDAAGFFDPSVADLWVLPLAADSQAPDVGARVVEGTIGDHGWFRSPATVALTASDNRDAAPRVQLDAGAGWVGYTEPVVLAEEGRHVVAYRATDAAGNTATGQLAVSVDATAPVTTMAVEHAPGTATVSFDASDAVSGVGRTAYRVDGGEWITAGPEPVVIEGAGEHPVEFASTDVAGNPEGVQRATVTVTGAEVPTDPPTTDEPTDPPTTDEPTDPPTTDEPTDPPTTDEPTDPPTTDEPTDPPTTEPPTDGPTGGVNPTDGPGAPSGDPGAPGPGHPGGRPGDGLPATGAGTTGPVLAAALLLALLGAAGVRRHVLAR
ncbi:OmpL47-type beta-barrel domain-containing protein [Georgenia faecalis]|uniref:OmpL47-type beta-barrel domain-containing protein n=1 Tax=Georgenia faecalis TaxID=2483799 RepID=UPI000FD812C1|nr:sialate O-acetylesterase [Georgenia faecalis]